MAFLRYAPSVEEPAEDEGEVIEKIIAAFRDEAARNEASTGQTVRTSHAKATGYLVGTLEVLDGLASELAQGLFATPARYAVLARLAQGPGEILPDSVSTHRGIGLKLIGVTGDKIPQSNETNTQDFVLEARSTSFPNRNMASFLQSVKGLSKAPSLPTGVKQAVSTVARSLERAVEAVGGESLQLGFLGHPKYNPVGECYFSQTPIRFGDHVAKLGLYPVSPAQQALTDEELDTTDKPNAFGEAVRDFCRGQETAFELRAQLALDDGSTPIEDAVKHWDEDDNPYRPIARLRFPAQDSYSDARRAYFDESLSFAPTHSLAAHRPLGSVMRARLSVYPVISAERFARSGAQHREPAGVDEVPA